MVVRKTQRRNILQNCIIIREDLMHSVCTLAPIKGLPVILELSVVVFSLHVITVHMQAIRDGVIEATIDHEQGFMQSKVRKKEKWGRKRSPTYTDKIDSVWKPV